MREGIESASSRPVLVLMVGAPGSGKSYLARLLAARLGARLVQTDVIRKRHFHPPRYTPLESARVYELAHAQLRRLLAGGRSAIFDATNLIESNRREVYRIAEQAGAGLLIVWTYAPEAVVAERMRARRARSDPRDVSDADWEVFEAMRSRAEPIPRPHFLVNTAAGAEPALSVLTAEARRLAGGAEGADG